MIDKKLLFQCMQDDEFEKILNDDEVLDALEKKKYSRQDEYFQFISNCNGNLFVSGMLVQPITLSVWCLLWILENAFVTHARSIENEDIDLFMYILTKGIKNISSSLSQLYIDSKDFCKKHNLDYEETKYDIFGLIQIAFKPLEMLPSFDNLKDEKGEVSFDVDWMMRLANIVSKQTSYSLDLIINNLSLNTVYYFYINHLRETDIKNLIKKRSSGEINEAIFKRTYELAEEYYKKNYEDK